MHVSVLDQPGDTVVLVLRGDLDIDTAPALHTALGQILGQPLPKIVVDLSGVSFCDSTGLSALVLGHRHAARHGGWLRLAAPSDWLRQLLTTVGLTKQLSVHPDVATALAEP
jgi:anti-sigma B factor antagonist